MKPQLPLLALLLASTPCIAQTSASPATPPTTASAVAEDQRLMAFLDAAFDESLALSPENMTGLGLKTDYGKLDDYTDAHRRRVLDLSEAQLARMKATFDPARLSPAGRLSYRLFERDVEEDRAGFEWRWHAFPISTNGTPAGQIPAFLINQHSIADVAQAEAYVSRLRDVERVMSEVSANVRYQASQGIVPPKMVFKPAREDAAKVLVGAPFDDGPDTAVFADFKKKVAALDAPAEVKARLVEDARAALVGPFQRGYRTMFAALDEIEPLSKGNDAAWSLPRGEAFYAYRLHRSTTTDLTPDQVHQIGLDQVKRVHAEMEAIKRRVGFEGSLTDFFEYIKTDPRFKYTNDEAGRAQYLADARGMIAQVMAASPKWFSHLPKAALEVRPVEQWRENTAAPAFYNRPAADGSRPGIYYVNLADMTQVQKPQAETFAYHEGAPGHHFQIARAQELENMPKFRRFGGYGVYSEGWGLYAELLGKDMGFFTDPYSEFGMLSSQLWRSIRLVLDTGLHAKRWSREQAIDYFKANSPVSERDIVKEVERYINNPGQATSYMIGNLKIQELRDRAQAALGNRFDIRDFHEVVLANGAMPLDVLEDEVDAWIASKKS